MDIGKVSIIVPLYNLENYVEKCVVSLLNQSYTNIDVILIDDGSKDSTCKVAQGLTRRDKRVKLISQDNGGAASARNTGLKAADGEFIMFVDGDDYIAPDTIEKNIRYFENTEVDWVSFPVIRVDDKGQDIISEKIGVNFNPTTNSYIPSKDFAKAFLEGKMSGLVCGGIFRNECLLELEFPKGRYYEDSFYYLDVLARSRGCMISSEGRYNYVCRDNSSQHVEVDEKRLRSKAEYDKKFIHTFEEQLNCDRSRFLNRIKGMYFYYRLQKAKRIPNSTECFNAIREVIGSFKLSVKQWLIIFIYEFIGYERLKQISRYIKSFK